MSHELRISLTSVKVIPPPWSTPPPLSLTPGRSSSTTSSKPDRPDAGTGRGPAERGPHRGALPDVLPQPRGLGHRLAQRRVTVARSPVELTANGYAVLYELSAHAGMALTAVNQGHWDRGIHKHWDTPGRSCSGLVPGCSRPVNHPLCLQQGPVRGKPFSVAAARDDDWVAAVGQSVQGPFPEKWAQTRARRCTSASAPGTSVPGSSVVAGHSSPICRFSSDRQISLTPSSPPKPIQVSRFRSGSSTGW